MLEPEPASNVRYMHMVIPASALIGRDSERAQLAGLIKEAASRVRSSSATRRARQFSRGDRPAEVDKAVGTAMGQSGLSEVTARPARLVPVAAPDSHVLSLIAPPVAAIENRWSGFEGGLHLRKLADLRWSRPAPVRSHPGLSNKRRPRD